MGRVAQLLEENVECDYVDINMGCPIDLVFKKGMGSGLMARSVIFLFFCCVATL